MRVEAGQLRRWNKRFSSLDNKVFLILDHRMIMPSELGLSRGRDAVRIWSTLRDGKIDTRTDSEIEDFSEVISETG
jgi:hypothetical protein